MSRSEKQPKTKRAQSIIEEERAQMDAETFAALWGSDAVVLAHIDGEPARLAAAREEQREACATAAAEWAREAALARGEPGNLFDAVMTTPLTSRPLADRIAELEKELSKAEWRVAELEDDVADTRILLEPHFGQETYKLPLAKTTADLIAEWQRREAAEEKAEEGVRYWTDLAQAEARDAAALRTRVAELEAQLSKAEARVKELEAQAVKDAVLAKYPEGTMSDESNVEDYPGGVYVLGQVISAAHERLDEFGCGKTLVEGIAAMRERLLALRAERDEAVAALRVAKRWAESGDDSIADAGEYVRSMAVVEAVLAKYPEEE